MTRRERDELGLDVEEIDLDAWGNPLPGAPSGPPTTPPRDAGAPAGDGWTTTGGATSTGRRMSAWMRRHIRHVAAGAAAVAVLAVAIAIATGPSSDPEASPDTLTATTAPTSTERRPVATPRPATTTAPPADVGTGTGTGEAGTDVDYRFALAGIPDGFEVTEASIVPTDVSWHPATSLGTTLFAAEHATWVDGPWLMVLTSRAGDGSWYSFNRPPAPVRIGDTVGSVGAAAGGEMTMFMIGDTTVSVIGRGLAPLETVGVADSVTVSAGAASASVAGSDLPDGLRARPELNPFRWEGGWGGDVRASIAFQDVERRAWLSINVRPIAAATQRDDAPFFLGDLHHLLIDGDTGVAGTYRSASGGDPVALAIWERGDRQYTASGYGMDVRELIDYASGLVHAGDDDWNGGRWEELREAAAACCVPIEPEPTVFDGAAAIASAGDDWKAAVEVGSRVSWQLTPAGANGAMWWVGNDRAATTPMLYATSLSEWAGIVPTFHVAVGALVDRAMVGARLRLATTGSEPRTVEVDLAVVDGTPYLAAAAVLPWTDGGFAAHLVAPDGRFLAVQTDADVP